MRFPIFKWPLVALTLIGALASPIAAQETIELSSDNAPDATDVTNNSGEEANEIIVEGYTKKQIKTFLWRSLIETNGSIAKRSTPICVGIDNAPDALEKPLRKRISANLAEFGVETANPGCKINAIVAFHRDAHLLVNWISDNHYQAFAALHLPEKRRLINPVRAAYSWHIIPDEAAGRQPREFLNFDEERLKSIQSGIIGTRTEKVDAIDSTHSFSIVDLDAIDGLTIAQLGDYLTMRMLVVFETDNRDGVPADSILRLFANGGAALDAPPEMSRLDRAILSEVYSPSRQNFRHGALRQAIARASVATLDEEGLMIETSDN